MGLWRLWVCAGSYQFLSLLTVFLFGAAALRGVCVLLRRLAGMCARRRSHFFSLRRKEVTQKRATPLSASPFALLRGQPAVLGLGGVSLELATLWLRQSRALIRPALRSSAQTEGRRRDSQQPKPKAQSPKPKAQSPKSKVQSPKSKVQSHAGHHSIPSWVPRIVRASLAERSKSFSGWCGCPARVAAPRSAGLGGSGLATV